VLDIKTALKARKAIGAPSPGNVSKQITKWQKQFATSKAL